MTLLMAMLVLRVFTVLLAQTEACFIRASSYWTILGAIRQVMQGVSGINARISLSGAGFEVGAPGRA